MLKVVVNLSNVIFTLTVCHLLSSVHVEGLRLTLSETQRAEESRETSTTLGDSKTQRRLWDWAWKFCLATPWGIGEHIYKLDI